MVSFVEVSSADRVVLERLARSMTVPHRTVMQARALLALADGWSVRATAASLGSYPNTVSRWRDRYLAGGVGAGGGIAPGRGRKPEIAGETVEAIVAGT